MNMKLKKIVFICLCIIPHIYSSVTDEEKINSRDGRKLFGGYRITPRYCKPSRPTSEKLNGPNICMFNHECLQRNGAVVGACMDGFLFGACCQLPDESAGQLAIADDKPAPVIENKIYTKSPTVGAITSNGVSHITNTLLNGVALPTAQDNDIVQINEQDQFNGAGVTHPTAPDTFVLNQGYNEINPDEFNPVMEDRKTTFRAEETTHAYVPDVSPFIQISISSSPSYFSPTPGFQKPIFIAKPHRPTDNDKYILVPTINHPKPNKTQEIDSIVNIIQMLNDSSTSYATRKPPSTSYVFSLTTTRRPGYDPIFTSTANLQPTTFYATYPTRKQTTKNKLTTSANKKTTTKPYSSKKPSTANTSKKPYISSSTFRPSNPTKKPPSTSYVYSTTINKRPLSTSTTRFPSQSTPSPPTVIVLGSLPANSFATKPSSSYSTYTSRPTTYSTLPSSSTQSTKHPVAVTINNHITQNIYSSTERPSPTVLITPKPTTSPSPSTITSYDTIETETSANDLNNFPPVRNPNLNMSIPVFDENDITTPDFIEDDALNTKVESFVNKIIAGLQEPFDGLTDVVYNKHNKTETTTKKPIKKQGTTKKPTARPSTTKRATTKRPVTTLPTKKPVTTTKRPKPTKKVTTTTENFIEAEENTDDNTQDYRSQCGRRPLMKSGRIVGGKGANFGEFPWQVLVRESTWLGLFTKNKCGGVLISNRYVMTAAHCQPGFLASLVAVFGEFDISGELETKRSISRNVKRVIVHRQYDAATFENDLALLELEHPIQFDHHIVPICLPRDSEDFTGRMATVTGWGRLKYGGGVPSVLQEVQVPIMENPVCQEMFRTAGHSKVILESFLCAGYANGQKDSCEGDSGGPLVLQRPDGRYQLAGTVSHGIKCAAPYLPGVYMRTTFYKPWIESITGVH